VRNKIKAAVLTKPRKLEICEFDKPRIGVRDILMKVHLCGICGSDVHQWEGKFYSSKPLIMGHEFIGEVAEGGDEALKSRRLHIGDMIAVELIIPCHHCAWCREGKYNLCCENTIHPEHGRVFGCNIPISYPPTALWGGYAQYLYVPAEAIVHRYPKRVNPKAGIFSEPLATSIHAINLGRLRIGDSCVIIGPGAIGLCTVVAAKCVGADPIILIGTAKDHYRLKIGKRLGATHIVDLSEEKRVVEKVKDLLHGGAHVCIDAAGSPDSQIMALKLTRRGGSCVLVGLSMDKRLQIIPDRDVVLPEITLVGCFQSAHGYQAAVKIIASGHFELEKLVTHEFSLDKISDAFRVARYREKNTIKVAINPWLESM